jgi:hypothetical protein
VGSVVSGKSIVRKQRLDDLYATDPEMGKTIEDLCVALMATRGVLIAYELESVLAHVNKQVEPWVQLAGVMPNVERRENFDDRKRHR